MKKTIVYLVTRKLAINDSCYVVASNKEEAKRKAEAGEFTNVESELIDNPKGWETGDCLKVGKSEAEVTNEIAREDDYDGFVDMEHEDEK